MHRLLLFTLVVTLLGLAWKARRAEVLAAYDGQPAGVVAQAGLDPTAVTSGRSGRADSVDGREFSLAGRFDEPELHQRLEARVEPRPDLWTALELGSADGPPAEQVLAEAEAWVAQHFPEGGDTAAPEAGNGSGEGALAVPQDPESRGLSGGLPAASGAETAFSSGAQGMPGAPGALGDDPLPPVFLATVARIESLGDDLPAWCGLLDLALLPAGLRDLRAGLDSGGAETAWISDERGQLIARVEALQGLGLELDPSWPWNSRVRRLYWTESGQGGLPARQFRLVLEGNGIVPTWTGRLVFLRSLQSGPLGQR